MLDWQVESLRLTLFRAKPIESVIPLWETLTGEKPEKVNIQPRDNMITEVGAVVLGELTHTSNPVRINWVLSPSKEQQTSPFPNLGSLLETKSQFIKMMSDWLSLNAVPSMNRLALGSVTIILEENRVLANKQLSELLHNVTIDIENTTDFIYQINLPIKSTVQPDLLINRLSKWSAVQTKGFELWFGDKPELISDKRGYFATRLELDINTHHSNKRTFPKNKLIPFLQELGKLGDQIAAEGYK